MRNKFISIIIPALNEETNIAAAIASSSSQASCDVIVADGGSKDKTRVIASQAGAKVLHCKRGRGSQMNCGAAKARGDMLLFLHADCTLPARFPYKLQASLDSYKEQHKREAEWACFESIQPQGLHPITTWLLRHCIACRTYILGNPYGDQALCIRKETFERLGGYQCWPLLEDLDLVQRLKQQCGRPAIIPQAICTSGRRWAKMGLLRTTLINQAVLLGHAAGVDVNVLAEWYAQRKQ